MLFIWRGTVQKPWPPAALVSGRGPLRSSGRDSVFESSPDKYVKLKSRRLQTKTGVFRKSEHKVHVLHRLTGRALDKIVDA